MAQHPNTLCGLYSHSLGVGGFVACAKLNRLPISSMTTSRELGPRWPPACPTAQPGGGLQDPAVLGRGKGWVSRILELRAHIRQAGLFSAPERRRHPKLLTERF